MATIDRVPTFRPFILLLTCLLGIGASRACAQERRADPIEDARWQESLVDTLRRDVTTLAESHPSRSVLEPDRLEASAAWLEERLDGLGFDVWNEVYEMPGAGGDPITVRNLIVEVPASGDDDRWLVIGAHYDTVRDTPGADDNASGVAGVLALATWFRDHPQPIGLRFELYTNEETLLRDRSWTGAMVRARTAKENDEAIVGAIILEMIGYYTGGPLSPLARLFANRAGVEAPENDLFLAIAGWDIAAPLAHRIESAWEGPVGCLTVLTPVGEPTTARSDHWAWLTTGVPAVMLTDTAEFRTPHYHTPGDTPDTLDFERMAQAVTTIRQVVVAVAARPPKIARRDEHQALTIENTGDEPIMIRVAREPEPHAIDPGASLRLSLALDDTLAIIDLATLRLDEERIHLDADRVSPPIRVTVPGTPGMGLFTRGGRTHFERPTTAELHIDDVRLRFGRPESGTTRFSTPAPNAIRIDRDFEAPLESVWRAHVEPDLVRRWMTGPPDHTLPICEIDFRVGGTARYVWKNPQFEMGMTATFREIVPHARIVHTERFDDWPDGDSTVTSTFTESGNVTSLSILIEYDDPASRDAVLQPAFEDGYGASYETLDRLLPEISDRVTIRAMRARVPA